MRLQNRVTWMAALAVLASTTAAQAQIVHDGNASPGEGYIQLSVQNTNTQFGDNSSADLIATASGGSEINGVYAKVEDGRLHVVLAGNLETNFNKMEVFIDSVSGAGQNLIDGTNLPAGVDAFCCGGFGTTDGALQRQDLLGFDVGFDADYYLTFSNGGENVGGQTFWAISAHFAELNNGTSGRNVRAGYQLAPQGLPNVLRGPLGTDFNDDFDVDIRDVLALQRGFGQFDGTTTVATKADGDSNADGLVDGSDLTNWEAEFGMERTLDSGSFNPFDGGPSSADLILPGDLPGLSQGDLIDQTYALSLDGGCTADDTDGAAGCAFRELEFALPVDSNDATNTLNHRDFLNEIDLKLGFDNSNVAGVSGDGGVGGDFTTPTTEDAASVTTGIEFSIPLSEIGSPGENDDIKITAYINGTGHDFASNQFSGTGVLTGNFGGLPPDLSTEAAGDQFVTITVPVGEATPVSAVGSVPEPGSAALVALAGLALGALRRR